MRWSALRVSWRRKRSSLARGDVATSQGGLSSGDPFARHIAEGIGIPLGGLLQLDLVVHDYAADGFVGLFGFILEPLRRMSSLPRTTILGSAISPPRACQQNGSKAYADYEFRGSALEA
jgi:hypothetical protein